MTISAKSWLQAIRVHQWLKNLLLFVPLLTSFSRTDSLESVGIVLVAFVAFSLAASSTYILNDLYDLESDRLHPRKRHRPFASGAIPIHEGVVGCTLLMSGSIVLSWAVDAKFLAMLLGYVLLTTVYSLRLKSRVMADVVMLALLYTYRVLTGAVVIDVAVTPSLLGFSIFIFLSLALVKRCAELIALKREGKDRVPGRDYGTEDLQVLWSLGTGASLCAVVVFGLYIGSPVTQERYASVSFLWGIAVGLIYWLSRLWVKTARGEMHDDPIVFAMIDNGSRWVIYMLVILVILAHTVNLGGGL